MNAQNHLIDMLAELGAIDRTTASKVARYYVKHKLAKLDAVTGRASVKHGAYLDRRAITRAAEIVESNLG